MSIVHKFCTEVLHKIVFGLQNWWILLKEDVDVWRIMTRAK